MASRRTVLFPECTTSWASVSREADHVTMLAVPSVVITHSMPRAQFKACRILGRRILPIIPQPLHASWGKETKRKKETQRDAWLSDFSSDFCDVSLWEQHAIAVCTCLSLYHLLNLQILAIILVDLCNFASVWKFGCLTFLEENLNCWWSVISQCFNNMVSSSDNIY